MLVQASGTRSGTHPTGDASYDDDPHGASCRGGCVRWHQRISPLARCQASIPPDRLAASHPIPGRCLAAVRERIRLAHIMTTCRPWRSLPEALSISPKGTWTAPGACPDFHSLFCLTSSRVAPPWTSATARSALIFDPRVRSAGCSLKNPPSRSSTRGRGVKGEVDESVTKGSMWTAYPRGYIAWQHELAWM